VRTVADTNPFHLPNLTGDENAGHAYIILEEAEKGRLKISTSSMMIDDLVTTYRSQGYTIEQIIEIL